MDVHETLVGAEIAGYKLTEEIFRTNHSFVYKAVSSDNQTYCLKLVRRKNKEDSTTPQLFITESNALTILNHNSIVQVYDCYVVDHFFILITEYMKDGSLSDILHQRHFLNNTEAQQLVFSLALALQYCHLRNVAHRNIKPSNIMFNNGRVAFTDFHIRTLNTSEKSKKNRLSSLPYMAPEIIDNMNNTSNDFPDERAGDVWSLGVVLFQVLSGRLPWSATNYDGLVKQIKIGISSFTPRIPPMARDLISKMTTIEPLDRISFHEIIAHPWLSKIKTISIRSQTGKICLSTSLSDLPKLPYHSSFINRQKTSLLS